MPQSQRQRLGKTRLHFSWGILEVAISVQQPTRTVSAVNISIIQCGAIITREIVPIYSWRTHRPPIRAEYILFLFCLLCTGWKHKLCSTPVTDVLYSILYCTGACCSGTWKCLLRTCIFASFVGQTSFLLNVMPPLWCTLVHWGLVTPCGVVHLGQHWFR